MSKYKLNEIIIHKGNTFKVTKGGCSDCVFHDRSIKSIYGCGFYAQYSAGIDIGHCGCRANYILPNDCCFKYIENNLNSWRYTCLK